jgi:hypothetical protein
VKPLWGISDRTACFPVAASRIAFRPAPHPCLPPTGALDALSRRIFRPAGALVIAFTTRTRLGFSKFAARFPFIFSHKFYSLHSFLIERLK